MMCPRFQVAAAVQSKGVWAPPTTIAFAQRTSSAVWLRDSIMVKRSIGCCVYNEAVVAVEYV